jgi:WS/DGAT/MGAT family acyltransferase
MERLTPLSAAFLHAEDADPTTSMAIGSLAIFAPPAPAFEEFATTIAGRLPLVPRYRQRVARVPFDLAAPVWVDDPDFDLSWHLRHTAVAPPAGPGEVGALMARVMGQRMDRSRPMWEYWFVDGLPDGRWGLLSKLHHCMVDGVSGTDIYRLVLDTQPTPMPPVPDEWSPRRPPSTTRLVVRGAWDTARQPFEDVRGLAATLTSPRALARTTARTARGLAAMAAAALPTSRSSLVGPIEATRRYAWTSVAMDEVARIRSALGGSVNDVALAAISAGFRTLLEHRGEEPTAHALRSLVPVSVRAPGEESIPDNRISLLLPWLPVDLDDPVERLAVVRDRIRALAAAHEPEAGTAITTLAEHGPFGPVASGVRFAFHLPHRHLTTVTTNVPGPRQPLWALGRRLETILPWVPIADRVRIGIAIFSYDGTLTFGITADWASTPDVGVLADGIRAGMDELSEAARQAA